MILAAAALLASASIDIRLQYAADALEAGRVEQARLMISQAIHDGAKGEVLEGLLADIAAAQGRLPDALARYQALLQSRPDDAHLLERAAAAAWRNGRRDLALEFADRASTLPNATWRAWNILAICADEDRDWHRADEAYDRALAAAPERAELLNNKGWSYLLRGEWESALITLEQAFALKPSLPMIRNNLDFARAGLDEDLPVRRPHESDTNWSARLNDAGVAARMRNDHKRALAAFTRAIEIRKVWFKRAANNIEGLRPIRN